MPPLNFGPTALSPLSQGYMGVAPKQTIAEEAKHKKNAGKTAPAPYKQDYSFTAPGMFPGVSEKDKNILMSMTQNVPPAQRTQVQEQLFSEALPVIQNRELKNQRSESRQQMMYEMSKEADPMKRKSINFAMKTSEFADMIKEKNNLPMQIPDQEMMDAFFQEQPDAVESFTNWINKGDPELLYTAGLRERPKTGLAKIKENFQGRVDTLTEQLGTKGATGLEKGLNVAGFVAGSVIDPFNQALGYGMEKAYDASMAVDEALPAVTKYAPMLNPIAAVSNAAKDIGEVETGGYTFEGQPKTVKDSVLSYIGGNLQEASDRYEEMGKTNPRLKNAIDSGMPIADAVLTFAGIGATAKGIQKGLKTAGQDVLKLGREVVTEVPGALKGSVGGIANPVDSLAARLTKTASGQDKLFKAQSPTLNVLNKNRNFKTVRAESDMANDLIVKAGHSPVDTETRRIAHEATMKSKRAEVERAIGSKKDTMVDQNPFADILDGVIKDAKKSGLVKNSNDIKALEAEARAMRKQGSIDLPSLEKKKQYINGIVNNRGDSAVGDVYKNGMKQVTRAIGQAEDDLLSKIPGSFQKLKNEFGSLKGTYEDVLKADLKNQKAKGMNIMESYSRIEGIGDILGGTIGLFSRGSQGLADVGKGIGKFVMGKSLKKASDVDYLIENGFKDLISKNKGNVSSSIIPSSLPTIPKRTPVKKSP